MTCALSYVDALNSVDDLEPTSPPSLMCLVESLRGGMGVDERVSVAMVVITPSTGDVMWDEFEGKQVAFLPIMVCHISNR